MTPDSAVQLPESSPRWLTREMEQELFRVQLGGRLPFVIGVSGHMKIDSGSILEIEQQVRTQLRAWRDKFPTTPFIVLSELAEGADRLVARIATEPEINAKIIAPLPLPRDFFLADFSEDGKTEFQELLEAPGIFWFELPLMPGVSLSDVSRYGPARDEQYELAGAYISHHSHVLVALWDGVQNGKTGGTGAIVEFKLNGIPRKYHAPLGLDYSNAPVDHLETGPVIHFMTPRPRTESAEADALALLTLPTKPDILYPKSYEYQTDEEAHEFYFERMFQPFEFFNAEGTTAGDGAGSLLPDGHGEAGIAPEIRETLSYLERLFFRADQIAIKYAYRTRRTLIALCLLVGFGALGFDIAGDLSDFEELHTQASLSRLLFPALLLVAFVLHYIAKKRRFQDTHQDYRALAEGLRVQYFWQLSGISDPVASRYIGKQRSELYWIRRACLASRMFLPRAKFPLTSASFELVQKNWIENQHRYFVRESRREHHRLELFEGIKRVAFLTGFDILTVLALLEFHQVRHGLPHAWQAAALTLSDHHSTEHITLGLLAVMSAVIAALLHHYIEKMALLNHSKQYHRMERIYRTSSRRLSKLIRDHDLEAAQDELRLLGDAALGENGDWVITHRDRPLEVPHH